MTFLTNEDFNEKARNLELESCFIEVEAKKILLNKLKEMADATLKDFEYNGNDYAMFCSMMGQVAKVILSTT